jgi:autotransporter-associated beta strand protein
LNRAVTINAGGGVVEITTAGKTYTFSGQATGAGGVAKEGPGTLILSASNSYLGTTHVNAGTLLVNGTHNGGGAYTVANGGTLGGTGTIGSAVNVNAGGILGPGASIGTLTVDSASILGTLNIEYDGAASTIDKLTVTNLLSIAGSTIDFDNLSATPLSGAGPYILASYGSLTGTFSSVLNPPSGFTINYNYNGLKQIALVPGITVHPGDFNSDGDVDGADFVTWQSHFPMSTGALLTDGDGDGDGDVDGADFIIWQTNFPFGPGSGASPVPEPQTLALLAFGGLFALAGRRLKRRSK